MIVLFSSQLGKHKLLPFCTYSEYYTNTTTLGSKVRKTKHEHIVSHNTNRQLHYDKVITHKEHPIESDDTLQVRQPGCILWTQW